MLSNPYIVIVWQGYFSMFFDTQLQGSAIFTLALKTYSKEAFYSFIAEVLFYYLLFPNQNKKKWLMDIVNMVEIL